MIQTAICFAFVTFSAISFAQYDVEAPELISISASGNFLVGNEAALLVEASDHQAGIADQLQDYEKRGFKVSIVDADDNLEFDIDLERVEKISETQFKLIFFIGEMVQPGEYTLETIQIVDKANNVAEYRVPYIANGAITYLKGRKESSIPIFKFQVRHPLAENDLKAPEILGMTVTGNLLAEEEFSVIVQAIDAGAGVSPKLADYEALGFKARITDARESLEFDIDLVSANQISERTFQLNFKIGNRVQPGEYTLSEITIADKANNVITYKAPYSWDVEKNYLVKRVESPLPVLKLKVPGPVSGHRMSSVSSRGLLFLRLFLDRK